MEHGNLMHQSLYGEVLRIPLVLSVPRTAPQKIRQPVGLIDIYPTVLGLLGLEKSPSIEGRDVSDVVAGLPSRPLPHPVISERYSVIYSNNTATPLRQRTIITPKWKMHLRSIDGNAASDIELFDVVKDPWDTTNIADKHPFAVWQLKQIHRRFDSGRSVQYPQNTTAPVPSPSPEQQQRLFHY